MTPPPPPKQGRWGEKGWGTAYMTYVRPILLLIVMIWYFLCIFMSCIFVLFCIMYFFLISCHLYSSFCFQAPRGFCNMRYINIYYYPRIHLSVSWDPYYQDQIHKVEMVQRRAARFVMNDLHPRHSVTQCYIPCNCSLSMKDEHISRSSWCTRSFTGILPFHQNLHTSSLPHIPPEDTRNIDSIVVEPHVSWTPSFPVQPAVESTSSVSDSHPYPRSVSESTGRGDSPTTHYVAEQQDCFLLPPVCTFWYFLYWIGSHPQLLHFAICNWRRNT